MTSSTGETVETLKARHRRQAASIKELQDEIILLRMERDQEIIKARVSVLETVAGEMRANGLDALRKRYEDVARQEAKKLRS